MRSTTAVYRCRSSNSAPLQYWRSYTPNSAATLAPPLPPPTLAASYLFSCQLASAVRYIN